MLSAIRSIALNGLEGFIINIEVDTSNGIPIWEIVGLPDASIKESKERVKSAIKNSGLDTFSKRVVINLSPANIKKEGSMYDLPIAIGVLASTRQVKNNYKEVAFIGELSLNGNVNPVNGVLPMCIEAKKLGFKTVIIPYGNLNETSIVDGVKVLGAHTLKQVVNYINYGEQIDQAMEVNYQKLIGKKHYNIDFSDIRGQENVKRAIEIAVTGGHNILMIGSPGSGKTMMARRIETILPKPNLNELVEINKIYSIAGKLKMNKLFKNDRPFRNPNYTITTKALIGGGSIPKPGEISLANKGILFLDELSEFSKEKLDLLREPLESKKVSINRINSTVTFPCDFIFVAAMNPCPCGYRGSEKKQCTCSDNQIKRYLSKISGPLLDRIDIVVSVDDVEYEKINNYGDGSEKILERIIRGREIQKKRYKEQSFELNSNILDDMVKMYCNIDNREKEIMKMVFEKKGLSTRSYIKILKIARTIADIEECKNIEKKHLLEAIQYRSLESFLYNKGE